MSGKNKIDIIFIILTPFHYKSFLSNYQDEMNQKNVLILKEKYIDSSNWQNSNAFVIDIPEDKFSVYDLKKNFLIIKTYRGFIKNIKRLCNRVLDEFDFKDSFIINIGTDRDIFTQIFLNIIYKKHRKKKIKLIAFEEGIGFYDKKISLKY